MYSDVQAASSALGLALSDTDCEALSERFSDAPFTRVPRPLLALTSLPTVNDDGLPLLKAPAHEFDLQITNVVRYQDVQLSSFLAIEFDLSQALKDYLVEQAVWVEGYVPHMVWSSDVVGSRRGRSYSVAMANALHGELVHITSNLVMTTRALYVHPNVSPA